jgi:hypothetical protein
MSVEGFRRVLLNACPPHTLLRHRRLERLSQKPVEVKPMTAEEVARHFEVEVLQWTPLAHSASTKKGDASGQ